MQCEGKPYIVGHVGERLEDSWKQQRSAVVVVNGLNGTGRKLGHAITGLEKKLAYGELEKQHQSPPASRSLTSQEVIG